MSLPIDFYEDDDGPIGMPVVIEQIEQEDLYQVDCLESWQLLTMSSSDLQIYLSSIMRVFADLNCTEINELKSHGYVQMPLFANEAPMVVPDGCVGSMFAYVSASPNLRGDILEAAITCLIRTMQIGCDNVMYLALVELNSKFYRVVDLNRWKGEDRDDLMNWIRAQKSAS